MKNKFSCFIINTIIWQRFMKLKIEKFQILNKILNKIHYSFHILSKIFNNFDDQILRFICVLTANICI